MAETASSVEPSFAYIIKEPRPLCQSAWKSVKECIAMEP